MQGCNQYCTFCIVPLHARRGAQPDDPGHRRRMPRNWSESGVKEITLLGQIVTSYGKRDSR